MKPDPFDPFDYQKDMLAHPDKYFSMAWLVQCVIALRKIKGAATLEEITGHWSEGKTKADGDQEVIGWLTDAARKRKGELTNGTR